MVNQEGSQCTTYVEALRGRRARRNVSGFRRTRLLVKESLFAIICVSILSASSIAVAAPSGAEITHHAVKPDFAYFQGKTITIVAAGSVGGTSWTEAEVAAPLIGSYLHATVNVLDISTGGSFPGQDYAASQPPNGLTIGELLPQGDLEANVLNSQSINFSMKKVNLIGSPLSPASIFFARSQSGIRNMEQVLKSSVPIPTLNLVSGLSYILTEVFFGAYEAKTPIVTGYPNVGSLITGFLRGDGSLMVTSLTAAESDAQSGAAVPILQATTPVKGTALYSIMKNVPTLSEFYKDHKTNTAAGNAAIKELITLVTAPFLSFYVAANTPQPYVVALQDAYRSAIAQTSARNQLLNAGLAPGNVSPKISKAFLKTEALHISRIKKFLSYSG